MTPLFLTSIELRALYLRQALELLLPVVHEAARGEFTIADIADMAERGRLVVGVGLDEEREPRIAIAFEFVNYPQQQAINIVALGGKDMSDFIPPHFEAFKAWAREAGVETIEASCSAAMARMLKPLGFEPTYHVVRATTRSEPCH